MGSNKWDARDWQNHQTKTAGQSRAQIFTSSVLHDDLNPAKIAVRESCDSAANPASTPIILAVDETGSMGELAELIIKKDLGIIMQEVYDRKPVTDPHIMCMAVGDAYSDRSALQVTQFEASIVLADQLKNFHLEGNGGGNGGESYTLAWYFAAFKTKCDAQIKRGRKGYLFTIGDEAPHDTITKEQLKHFLGVDAESGMSTKDLLGIVSQHWEVFHLIVKPAYPQAVTSWRALLGERAIEVDDHTKLAEVIVSTMQVIEGADVDQVAASWSGSTAVTVANAVRGLTKTGAAGAGVSRL